MEEVSLENKKDTMSTITNAVNVLAIGDEEETSESNNLAPISKQKRFQMRYEKHLSILLNGGRPLSSDCKKWNSYEYFSVASIKEENQPRRYHFRCSRKRDFRSGEIFNGPTFKAQHVMDEVRKVLKDENWISEYVIETPLKGKTEADACYNCDQYIQNVASYAMGAAYQRIFLFVLHLHKEYMKNN
ncbi:uncharacterized protein LOC116805012 [Drosophila grimshawi]|uniref:uncharacterized protein LOC116805012 n=1 Tax=Drosophila grimshawi TaxID=7222 RepID=UPI0013EF4118|nr:uncharacterized protein LOC116805012 [Drosophila grimshawi]